MNITPPSSFLNRSRFGAVDLRTEKKRQTDKYDIYEFKGSLKKEGSNKVELPITVAVNSNTQELEYIFYTANNTSRKDLQDSGMKTFAVSLSSNAQNPFAMTPYLPAELVSSEPEIKAEIMKDAIQKLLPWAKRNGIQTGVFENAFKQLA